MGGVSTKEEILARLDDLDKRELEVNLKLKQLQIELNKLVPEEERLQVNENLGPNGEIHRNDDDDGGYKKKGRGKAKSKKKARDEEDEDEDY